MEMPDVPSGAACIESVVRVSESGPGGGPHHGTLRHTRARPSGASIYKEYLKQVRWYQTIEAHQKAMRKRQV
jgi:hypothetical protein